MPERWGDITLTETGLTIPGDDERLIVMPPSVCADLRERLAADHNGANKPPAHSDPEIGAAVEARDGNVIYVRFPYGMM